MKGKSLLMIITSCIILPMTVLTLGTVVYASWLNYESKVRSIEDQVEGIGKIVAEGAVLTALIGDGSQIEPMLEHIVHANGADYIGIRQANGTPVLGKGETKLNRPDYKGYAIKVEQPIVSYADDEYEDSAITIDNSSVVGYVTIIREYHDIREDGIVDVLYQIGIASLFILVIVYISYRYAAKPVSEAVNWENRNLAELGKGNYNLRLEPDYNIREMNYLRASIKSVAIRLQQSRKDQRNYEDKILHSMTASDALRLRVMQLAKSIVGHSLVNVDMAIAHMTKVARNNKDIDLVPDIKMVSGYLNQISGTNRDAKKTINHYIFNSSIDPQIMRLSEHGKLIEYTFQGMEASILNRLTWNIHTDSEINEQYLLIDVDRLKQYLTIWIVSVLAQMTDKKIDVSLSIEKQSVTRTIMHVDIVSVVPKHVVQKNIDSMNSLFSGDLENLSLSLYPRLETQILLELSRLFNFDVRHALRRGNRMHVTIDGEAEISDTPDRLKKVIDRDIEHIILVSNNDHLSLNHLIVESWGMTCKYTSYSGAEKAIVKDGKNAVLLDGDDHSKAVTTCKHLKSKYENVVCLIIFDRDTDPAISDYIDNCFDGSIHQPFGTTDVIRKIRELESNSTRDTVDGILKQITSGTGTGTEVDEKD